ncbi:MAG: bifunctional 2',3'-cyclic-nucleotide 2'-phosphodiesterase/3'-nucleotidase [Rhodocyclaceae bacterium]
MFELDTRRMRLAALAVAAALSLAACGSDDDNNEQAAPTPETYGQIDLTILETTDLHTNVFSYDYYKTADDLTIGFERTAALINQARATYKNVLLVDNGDTIQGTSMADYQALVSPLKCDELLGIYKVMDYLKYDIGTMGNHEFNYGLDYLNQVQGRSHTYNGATRTCKAPATPFVVANVNDAATGKAMFTPWTILTRQYVDSLGKQREVKVGVIGFTPPAILQWDKRWLEGKVAVEGIKDSAARYVPQMRAAGADVVVALAHSGISTETYRADMENAVYYLADVPGIDAIVAGHSHTYFPSDAAGGTKYTAADVDNTKGLIKGVPVVQAGFWGSQLGLIQLQLTHGTDGKWSVDKTKSVAAVKQIYDKTAKQALVAADPKVNELVGPLHQETIKYVQTPIGQTELRLSSYLSQVADTASLEVLNAAQKDYVSKYVQANLPKYATLPVLSAQAPFKGGYAGATDYTDVQVGPVSIRSAADLYLYSNTVYAVKISGKALKGWLENSGNQFNQIDPAKTTEQQLLNSSFAVYNYDVIDGVQYEIDVTQPIGSRIVNLRYNNAPVTDTQQFIVATNNYRASGITNTAIYKYIDPAEVEVILASPDANRDVVINYVKDLGNITSAKFTPDRNWRLAKLTAQAGKVVFSSAPQAADVMAAEGVTNVTLDSATPDSKGLVRYSIDLTK